MIYVATSLYDEKTQQYMAPQFEQNEATARRNFAFALKRNDSLAFAAADLRLYNIGSFDSDSGIFTGNSVPTLIVDGKEFINE